MNNMKFTHNPLRGDAFVEKNVIRNHWFLFIVKLREFSVEIIRICQIPWSHSLLFYCGLLWPKSSSKIYVITYIYVVVAGLGHVSFPSSSDFQDVKKRTPKSPRLISREFELHPSYNYPFYFDHVMNWSHRPHNFDGNKSYWYRRQN
jgi:hypothetical protein